MGLLSRAFSRLRDLVVKGAENLSLVPFGGLSGFFSGTKASNAKLMAEAVGWVFACISRISETVISQRLRLYRKTGSGPEDWTEVTDHEFLDLLQKPNRWMPGSDLMQMWSEHEDLTGNAYWLLDGVTNETDKPQAIYPLNPAYMKVIVGKVAGEPDQIVAYEYQAGQDKRVFKPYEILHFRRTNPNDPFRGLGPTEGSMDSVDTDNWMREWNRNFFKNSAIPGVILETTNTSAEMVRLLRESFEDRHGGVSKAHKTVALPNGVKLAQMSYGQKDMDFVESRMKNRDEILASFGVTPIVLGLGMGESGLNRATAEVQEYVFSKYTIKPKLTRFECYINEFFLSRFGDDLAIAFDDPVPRNVEQNIQLYAAALGGGAYMTMNEVRAREGLEPIEGGDALPQKPADFMLSAPKAVNGHRKGLRLPMTSKATKSFKQAKEAIVASVTDVVTKAILESKKKNMEQLTTVDWLENWKAFVGRTVEGEKKMRAGMIEYAKAMTKRAEDGLKKKMKKKVLKATDFSKILNEDDEVSAIIDITTPVYLEILKREGISAAELVDSAFDENDERMLKALRKSISLMAKEYTATTMAQLEKTLLEGIEEDENLDALADRVRDIGAWSEGERAEKVANTEAFRTANYATKEAWKQSGVVTEIKWYTAEDERVCESCGIMEGKVVGIDENFADKGDTVGDLTISYANVEAGSLHPNCRCYVRPETIEV